MLDDGRLTDSQGRVVDFKNTIIIMTSNIGSSAITGLAFEATPEEVEAAVKDALTAHFKPEFLNRVDDKVVFNPLSKAELQRIVALQLTRLRKRLRAKNMALDLTDAALSQLATESYEPAYGARPVKRAIMTLVETPLSRGILGGKFGDGDVVRVDYSEEKSFTYEKVDDEIAHFLK